MGSADSRPQLQGVARALIVDDDALVATTLKRFLVLSGCRDVDCAHTGADAIDLLTRTPYQLVLLDLRFEGDWRDILSVSLSSGPRPAVIMMSGSADVQTAVEAMRLGATDFLEKPISAEEAFARIEQALVHTAMRRKLNRLEGEAARIRRVEPASPSMRPALDLARRVAETPSSSALIVGESGVGKEVLAARIHEASARRDAPFVRVNLAAIAESMVEAELFGSVRGAFTDSKRDRAGYLASADGGTILLDEIGEFRLDLQAKLLRAIEERRFFAVGSDRERSVNVRFLAATNRSPEELLASRSLRADLYYRLGTVIRIPPLRERLSEIPELAEAFVTMFCQEFGRARCSLTPDALDVLLGHSWPGNIRELRNAIERAVMTCDGAVITAEHIEVSPLARPNSPPPSLRLDVARDTSVDQVEREHILRVLEIAGDSKSRAADLLGVSRSTLYEKLKRYGIG